MRVALLSYNARAHDAIGNHVAETVGFFLDRGAAVRVFVESTHQLHPDLRAYVQPVDAAEPSGPVWDYLSGADLVIAQFSQGCELLHYLPMLAGGKPRLMLDYHGVTPPELWPGSNWEALEQGLRQRGLIWCVDAAITHSDFTRRELTAATGFPAERIHRLPLVVDATRFRPGPRRSLHHRLGLGNVAILLYVGRLASNKRVPLLVDALTHLPAHVHAVIIGDTTDIYASEAQRCRDRAMELHVADRVHLLGQVGEAELADAYRCADVLVIPSLHEGFCVPVIEAMASGLPVVASRSAALPETVGDAGLTFAPDDAGDLARQVMRVLARRASEGCPRARVGQMADPGPRRIAVVCFRFGAEIVGGAETSLRAIAAALADAGHAVEAFTTCTRSESAWCNELPAGTTKCDGLTVHRFPIDPHDRAAHLEAVRVVVDAAGRVSPEAEEHYVRHSIHSSALLQAISERVETLDAIIVGPYLFGLTYDVANAFPERTLLLPCFHDEPLARLALWPQVYGRVAGMLMHSPEEMELTLRRLGINGPNVVESGTYIDVSREAPQPAARAYVVYCGRYSAQKNLPLLLDWMQRFQESRPDRVELVCMGHGEVTLPRVPWLRDFGRVNEERKRSVLAGARALIQLSQQESLSLVALEAWGQATPVIVHAACAVLAGQVERSQGGVAVEDYDAFARALDELTHDPDAAAERGRHGQAYVEREYGSRARFVTGLETAIAALDMPLCERMRQRGLAHAAQCDRAAWRVTFAHLVENLLEAAPRMYRRAVSVEPLQAAVHAGRSMATTLIAVRVHNDGTHAVVADGPARTVLHADVREPRTGRVLGIEATELPGLLAPAATQTAMLLVPVPGEPGTYDLRVGAAGEDSVSIPLHVGQSANAVGVASLLDGVRQLLVTARLVQRLPDDYVDVTQGWFARWKRWIKRKLLHNFKHAYVDVLSRRQSQVNEQLVAAVHQLADCCATLDHALQGMQRRQPAPPSRGQQSPQAGAAVTQGR
jgi:glycosyltransferase involved in cell wall biosynthesis